MKLVVATISVACIVLPATALIGSARADARGGAERELPTIDDPPCFTAGADTFKKLVDLALLGE